MKSIPVEAVETNDTELKKAFKDQLKRQLVIGMSYGAKATAQTIKDIITAHVGKAQDITNIDSMTDSQKDEILSAVIHFINTTVSSDTKEVAKVISNKIGEE